MSTDLVSERVASLLACPREHQGQRVVTLSEVDRVHGRKRGTAKNAFHRHKHRMTEGVHYFRLGGTSNVPPKRGGHRGLTVNLTERGYLLLVKAFTDDLAWQVQDTLVESYFEAQGSMVRVPEGWRLVRAEDLDRIVCLVDESQRTVAKAAQMAKPSDAAAILGLRRHDSTPGPRQTKRAGTKMRDWREAPKVREAAKIGHRENPAQALIDGVSYTVLTDRGGSDLAALVAGLVSQAIPAAIEKALAAHVAGGVS